MISFALLPSEDAGRELAARARARRLAQNLTLEGLAARSGVALGTLKRFERTGMVSLVSFVRLSVALKDEAALDGLLAEREFETLEDVLKPAARPKRGRIK